MLRDMAQELRGIILSYADPQDEGRISRRHRSLLYADLAHSVRINFVDQDGRSVDDDGRPLSRFSYIVYEQIEAVTLAIFESHHRYLQRNGAV